MMGDLYYIIMDNGKKWKYVCYGKQLEVWHNHKELLAAFNLIEWCHESGSVLGLVKGSDSLEYFAKKRFGDEWFKFLEDVSQDYLADAEYELSL